MDAQRRSQRGGGSKDGEGTKAKVTKSCGKQSQEKPALSPIEEETDSPDSSGDSAINFRGIEPEGSAKNYPYDLRVSLREDYEEVLRELRDEGQEGKQQAESPPFLTARNGSDHEAGSKSGDSNSTRSNEKSTPEEDDDDDDNGKSTPDDDDIDEDEDDPEDDEEDVSSFPGESSSGDADYRCNSDDQVEGLEGDLEEVAESANQPESSERMKDSRPKSAPSSVVDESSVSNREERLHELATSVDWLKARLAKSERVTHRLKKQLSLEKSRNRKFAVSYEQDREVMRESLRIDLELWIKKLNDGLKGYLAEWQQRERLRINEEISRISDLYSQEIAKSLRTSLKEWQTEDAKKLLELMDKRDRQRRDRERANANAVYEKIQSHLENLEKRNRKSYASFRKQIDKWEERLRDEVVKLREEDLKKLRQQVDLWHDEERKKCVAPSPSKTRSKDRGAENEGCSFPGSETLLDVEENLLKRLRDSSTRDLRRTEQIVRTELKTQRRELAKRMNEKIAELWMAFEEFGFAPGVGADRARPRRPSSGVRAAVGRNDLDDCRAKAGSLTKDMLLNPDVFGGRRAGAKIAVRDARADGSTRSSTDVEDGDRDYKEDEDEDDDDDEDEVEVESLLKDKSEKTNEQSPAKVPSTPADAGAAKDSPTPNEATGDTSEAAEVLARETATRK